MTVKCKRQMNVKWKEGGREKEKAEQHVTVRLLYIYLVGAE